MLRQLLVQSLESSTAHGLSRATSNKGWTVRAFWLLLFAAFSTIFCLNFAELARKLQAGGTSSSLASDSLDFVFPDMYFCFDTPLSGSRYLTANRSVADQVRQVFDRVDAEFAAACANATWPICSFPPVKQFFKVNSLPFSLLAGSLARRLEQTVVESFLLLGSGINIQVQPKALETFHHATHVRCFRLRLSADEQRRLLRAGELGGVYLTLMLDNYHRLLHKQLNGSHSAMPTVLSMIGGQLPAAMWLTAMESMYMDDRLPAVRLFLVPPGQYPSPFVKNFLLSAGHYHTVDLAMVVEAYDEAEFAGRCLPKQASVRFTDPVDNSPQQFAYSFAHCYYTQLREQIAAVSNITMGYYPQPYPPSRLESVWHLERTKAIFSIGPHEFNTTDPFAACSRARLCNNTVYSAAVSSLPWPPEELYRAVQLLLQQKVATSADVPALRFLLQQMSTDSPAVKQLLQHNLLKLRITASSKRSDAVTYSPAYSSTQFLADTGGILGMYLGMSLLTCCELLELLYSIVVLITSGPTAGKQQQQQEQQEQQQQQQEQQQEQQQQQRRATLGKNTVDVLPTAASCEL